MVLLVPQQTGFVKKRGIFASKKASRRKEKASFEGSYHVSDTECAKAFDWFLLFGNKNTEHDW